jgi:hypothetical protein
MLKEMPGRATCHSLRSRASWPVSSWITGDQGLKDDQVLAQVGRWRLATSDRGRDPCGLPGWARRRTAWRAVPRGVVGFRGWSSCQSPVLRSALGVSIALGGAWPSRLRRDSGGRQFAMRRGCRRGRRRRGGAPILNPRHTDGYWNSVSSARVKPFGFHNTYNRPQHLSHRIVPEDSGTIGAALVACSGGNFSMVASAAAHLFDSLAMPRDHGGLGRVMLVRRAAMIAPAVSQT